MAPVSLHFAVNFICIKTNLFQAYTYIKNYSSQMSLPPSVKCYCATHSNAVTGVLNLLFFIMYEG